MKKVISEADGNEFYRETIRLAKVKVLKSANEAKEESTMEEETNNPS